MMISNDDYDEVDNYDADRDVFVDDDIVGDNYRDHDHDNYDDDYDASNIFFILCYAILKVIVMNIDKYYMLMDAYK